MAVQDERGRRAPTPAALASLGPVPDGYRILPDPLHGQPLLRVPAPPAEVRLLLDRSSESAQAGEPTQDYLAVRCDPRLLSFVVADGVGSSFLGDVAAQILSAHLADFLAAAATARSGEPFDTALEAFLHRLTRDVAERVATWPISDSVPAIVRAALDQQRAYGSEAMFAGGVVELGGGRGASVTVVWLGDTRVRLIMRDGRQFDHSGQTTDRWSSRMGPRGTVRSQTWPVAEVARIIVCTDGLIPELDATVSLPDAELGDRLAALARRPRNDDIALIDVGLAPRAMPVADAGASPTLWRRLADEPPGRHARTTPAGAVLRRLIRGLAAPPAAAPPPSAPAPSPAVPPSTVVSASATVVSSSSAAAAAAAVPAAVVPAAMTPPAAVPAAAVPAPTAPPAEVAPAEGIAAPDGISWRRIERGRELFWSPVPGADSYAVQVCRERSFAEPLLYAVRGLSFALPPMPGPLFARVRSVAGGEPGPWGAKYDVADPPATPPAAGPGNAGPGNAGGS